MEGRVSKPPPQIAQVESSCHRALDQWVEAPRLITFDEIPAEVIRYASFIEFRGDSCEMSFETLEIRRVSCENQIAFNAINGEYCRMHSQVGIPLTLRV